LINDPALRKALTYLWRLNRRQIGNYLSLSNVRVTYCNRRTRGKRAKALSKVKISLAPDAKATSEIR